MVSHVALLRAVNVSGHNKVGAADLRGLLTSLGLEDGRSLLQSGNLVFRSLNRKTGELEQLLEAGARRRLRLDTDFFVRTAAEWEAVIAANPYPAEARRDPAHLLVVSLKTAPARARIAALQQAVRGRETARVQERHAYIVYPDGIARSRLTMAVIEKSLGTRGTGRNWNTVLKLAALF